jgi:hypothetical protein
VSVGVGGPEDARSLQAPVAVADPQRTVDGFKPIRVPGLLAARWLSFNVIVIAISLAIAVWHLTLLKESGTDGRA